ncbi:hypothetical protein GCM10009123_09210 [Kangiella japonica]|uniref:ComF family protein n=1 Tax=Kangiella japonica TaxID=647384 RepID=A0ABN0SWL0_9GAMM
MRDSELLIYLHDYHKYKVGTPKKVNPKFRGVSQQILNFKDPDHRLHRQAVDKFYSEIESKLTAEITPFQNFSLAIVPSHERNVTSAAMEEICRSLATSHKNMHYHGNPLVRTRTIPKLATGGDRSLFNHLASLDTHEHIISLKFPYVILDDIVTSGNSLAACKAKIEQAGASILKVLAIGKTVDE